MYRDQSVCLVIPAFNEATQLPLLLPDVPDFIDHIVIVNDGSSDGTQEVVEQLAAGNARITALQHEKNKGVGAARATGLRQAAEEGYQLMVCIDGDAQMDTEDIKHLLDPLVEDEADFTKGNRLADGEAWKIMPKFRFFANAGLSMFTKIASGFWHITDSQSGFCAMTARTVSRVDFDHIFPRYGCENHLLIHLSVVGARAQDVATKPIYRVGEVSSISVWRDTFPVVKLLFVGFFWRLWQKYVVRDFHPLVLFYAVGLGLHFVSMIYFPIFVLGRIIVSHTEVSPRTYDLWMNTLASPLVGLADLLMIVFSTQMIFFAMWMDMEENRRNR